MCAVKDFFQSADLSDFSAVGLAIPIGGETFIVACGNAVAFEGFQTQLN